MNVKVETLVLFGATGDLAHRMLFPSLYNLHEDGLLADTLTIVGSGRTRLDRAAFHTQVREALADHLPGDRLDAAALDGFLARIDYCAVDAGAGSGYDDLAALLGERMARPIGVYLSTPPSMFGAIAQGLAAAGIACAECRIAMEKPIGHDLASSRAVNEQVASAFAEDHVFRIDHYLGKETVQNLLALRFANMLFEPLWNAQAIDHVQITVAETVGLEGRVSYYDGVGALRDMVQNHMLQLLAIIAMEPPASVSATAVRDEKVKLLRSLRRMSAADVKAHSVKGQYASGAVDGVAVKGYADELGHASNTETFVALKAFIDNWRWKGVPFYLRTGKRMPKRQSEVLIQFKPVPHNIFARVGAAGRGGDLDANMMIINLQPEENIRVTVMAKQPGLDRDGVKLKEVTLDVSLSHSFAGERRRIAYERLLLDFIEGDQTLFVRRDEVEAQWEWIDAIRDAWDAVDLAPQAYTAGSWGPSSAIALIERDGASWHD
ncbi:MULTISPECIES: glucose-6-phosphate dehydrogenase [Sphingopyxis]|nr:MULTISPECIES: glucose-6-phosphate dehydrogenase [Sphingopyxis]APW73521.1 glucose-6-phosphate dehydrogenase [Sphingopyxis granuli]AVA14567.1 glucose-6-phosphate dehydrogenase [Sphingopyxis sp. MG]